MLRRLMEPSKSSRLIHRSREKGKPPGRRPIRSIGRQSPPRLVDFRSQSRYRQFLRWFSSSGEQHWLPARKLARSPTPSDRSGSRLLLVTQVVRVFFSPLYDCRRHFLFSRGKLLRSAISVGYLRTYPVGMQAGQIIGTGGGIGVTGCRNGRFCNNRRCCARWKGKYGG